MLPAGLLVIGIVLVLVLLAAAGVLSSGDQSDENDSAVENANVMSPDYPAKIPWYSRKGFKSDPQDEDGDTESSEGEGCIPILSRLKRFFTRGEHAMPSPEALRDFATWRKLLGITKKSAK